MDNLNNLNKEAAPTMSEEVKQRFSQRGAMMRLLSKIRNYDKSSQINQFTIGENKLWLDKATRASLLVRIEAERLAGKTSTTFWSNSNEYSMPLDEAKSIINAVEIYASECYDNTQRHLRAAKSLATVEEIKSYDYKSGYPNKLSF